MSIPTELQLTITDITDQTDGEWDVIITTDPWEVNYGTSGREYEMASLGKLAIALFDLEFAQWSKDYQPDRTVKLRDEHKRGGTGILKHFDAGLELTLQEALSLMIAESDNTAANIVLEALPINCTADIVEWLQVSYHVDNVGLAPRNNLLFESGVATAAEMFMIWAVVCKKMAGTRIERAFRQSHFHDGLRAAAGCQKPSTLFGGKSLSALSDAAGMLRMRSMQRWIVSNVLERPGCRVPSKEGALNWEGEGFMHEVAVFPHLVEGKPLYLGVFSRGWPVIKNTADHPAWSAIRHIGREVYYTSKINGLRTR